MSRIGVNKVFFNKNFWEFQMEGRGRLANFAIGNSAGMKIKTRGGTWGIDVNRPW